MSPALRQISLTGCGCDCARRLRKSTKERKPTRWTLHLAMTKFNARHNFILCIYTNSTPSISSPCKWTRKWVEQEHIMEHGRKTRRRNIEILYVDNSISSDAIFCSHSRFDSAGNFIRNEFPRLEVESKGESSSEQVATKPQVALWMVPSGPKTHSKTFQFTRVFGATRIIWIC